jgi:ribonuclease HII
LLDGGLKAPAEYLFQETIIKGDEKEPIIAMASIAAKVSRDWFMESLADKYQGYGFDKHKGYGTRAHYQAIMELGLSEIHRKSFLRGIDGII